MAQKVNEVLDRAATTWSDRPAMRQKRGGVWHTTTWAEYRAEARLVARAFIHLGLTPGAGVSIIGFNRPEWLIADLAAILAGGLPAGIYTTSSPEQCQYITDHCDAPIAVVENAEQLAKYKEVRSQLPKLKKIVLIEGEDPSAEVISWARLRELGATVPEAELEARLEAQKADDVCTLIYTSGTTGQPKGVMMTHHNLTWTAAAGAQILDVQPGDDALSYLPLSHIAEQIITVHGPMAAGSCVWFAESMEKLPDNLREVRPHLFLGVPRVWEKIQEKMQAAGASAPPLRKKLVAWARRVGLAGGYAEQNRRSRPLFYGLARALIYKKVRERIGLDRCRMQVTAAAPIAKDTLEFFLSLGIPIYEIYGMSECTGPATVSTPQRYRTGKCGWVLPGTEVKIADDGEICMRGPHVFPGYFKNPEATAEALDSEGWLHSGDVGVMDGEGFLQITDRKKDLIITAGGENVAPQLLEAQLKAIPVVSQAVVVGDRRKYLAALLTLDPEKITATAQAAGSPARDLAAAAACALFAAHLQKQIDGVNHHLARVQTIKKWTIIPGEFTVDGGELTPTMKIKRKVIHEKYAAAIEGLYGEGAGG